MTTYTAECKYCNKKFEVKSKWLPSACLDLAMETKGLIHGIAKHRKKTYHQRHYQDYWKNDKAFFDFLGVAYCPSYRIIILPPIFTAGFAL